MKKLHIFYEIDTEYDYFLVKEIEIDDCLRFWFKEIEFLRSENESFKSRQRSSFVMLWLEVGISSPESRPKSPESQYNFSWLVRFLTMVGRILLRFSNDPHNEFLSIYAIQVQNNNICLQHTLPKPILRGIKLNILPRNSIWAVLLWSLWVFFRHFYHYFRKNERSK